MASADALLAELEELAALHSEGHLEAATFELAKERALRKFNAHQEVYADNSPQELSEGQEVIAAHLQHDTDLNGVRGWVVGHQRAPDGTLLTLVRFDNGVVRLLSSANLQTPPVPPLPDLSGVWGCWYADPWLFHQKGDKLAAVDCGSGKVHHGWVRRGPPSSNERRPRSPRALRYQHPAPWQGPMDSPRRAAAQKPSAASGREVWKRLQSPPPRVYVCTISLQGCIGGFDGECIRWRSGAVWSRRYGHTAAAPRAG
eukprot:TRINITY_DN23534_c0_g1_i2.p1 TRINITY_DN23534_c0_g1~~TRINITY_DN23534_c0_g1_i2.p1  ORF type:complete len:275 (+),score=73.02 TRINITY_DN23534_c0_g1_i2:55-825(+)